MRGGEVTLITSMTLWLRDVLDLHVPFHRTRIGGSEGTLVANIFPFIFSMLGSLVHIYVHFARSGEVALIAIVSFCFWEVQCFYMRLQR